MSDWNGDFALANGAISPLPPVSRELSELVTGRPAAEPPQAEAAARVAASAAKKPSRRFHHGARGGAAEQPPGEPPKQWRVSPEELAQFLTYVECGYSLRQAAGAVGRSHATFVKLRKRDAEFAQALRRKREAARDQPLRQLRQSAERSWRAAAWLLKYLDGLER